MKASEELIILGGGPAGIAAGYYASRQGKRFKIYEEKNRIGGMCSTITRGDFRFDLGAHRLHDREPDVTADIRNLVGSRLSRIEIASYIFSRGRLIHFPLSPLNLISNLGPWTTLNAGFHWLASRFTRAPKSFQDFETYAVYKYGRPIAERFLLNYSKKLWGKDCGGLSPEISGKRLKGLCLSTFLLEAFSGGKARTEHLDGAFFYPQSGFGEIVERMADVIGREKIFLGRRVMRLEHHNGCIRKVFFDDGEGVQADCIISTLPLPVLVKMLHPACPHEIAALAMGLSFRKLILVMLMLNRESVTKGGTVYFPEPEFPFNRVSEPRNRSSYMAPPGKTSLLLEIPCGQESDLSEVVLQKYVRICVEKLEQIGWIREYQVLNAAVECLDYAYPVLDAGYAEKLERILRYMKTFQNLHIIGRNALFQYTHFHDMMRMARETVGALPT
jgi:protoporphyrinogen oxidase